MYFWKHYPSPNYLRNKPVDELFEEFKAIASNTTKSKIELIFECVQNDGDTIREDQESRDFITQSLARCLEQGIVDEVSIYNSALSSVEIVGLYEAGMQPAGPVLIEAVTSTDGTKILLTFDKEMAILPEAPAGFVVTVDGVDNLVQAVELNTENSAIVELTLASVIYSNAVNIGASYIAGTVTAEDGTVLEDFTDQSVANMSIIAPAPLLQEYIYDELNRLTSVLLPNGQVIEYQYDLGGNLISVRVIE